MKQIYTTSQRRAKEIIKQITYDQCVEYLEFNGFQEIESGREQTRIFKHDKTTVWFPADKNYKDLELEINRMANDIQKWIYPEKDLLEVYQEINGQQTDVQVIEELEKEYDAACKIINQSVGVNELELEIKRLKSENENISEILAETWEELRVLKLERNYFPCLTNRDK